MQQFHNTGVDLVFPKWLGTSIVGLKYVATTTSSAV